MEANSIVSSICTGKLTGFLAAQRIRILPRGIIPRVQERRNTEETKKRRYGRIFSTGGVGALVGAATPTVAVAGVHAIGFGTGGIVAGSAAAGMMSTSAVASGGGVASGGMIATLQSIGATSTFVAGPVTMAVGGAVIGVLCVGAGYGGYKLWKWATAKKEGKAGKAS